MHETNHKGAVAELEIAAAATRAGIAVLRPMSEHSRYDLVFEIAGRLLRVQCKWGRLDRGGSVINVALQSGRRTSRGYVSSSYSAQEIDVVAVYCGELERCYVLPGAMALGRRSVWLRLQPPANGQRACLNLADEV